jgi:hypothetical protein
MRRSTFSNLLVPVMLAAGIAGFPAIAAAHTPVLEQAAASDAAWRAPEGYGPARLFPGAQQLPDPRISRGVYGTLARGELFDAYRFDGPSDESAPTVTIPVEILVRATAANEALRPSIAIIGFGDAPATSLPAAVLEHLRAVQTTVPVTVATDPGLDDRSTEYEPFVGEMLWRGASATMTIEAGRTYYVLVFDPHGASGEYRLALGEAEGFTLGEAIATPVDILRIKLGLYGQDSFQWGFAVFLAAAVGVLGAGGVWLTARRRRRVARG